MRKTILTACAALLLGGASMQAQDVEKSWTSGSEVGEGKFIIYNTGLNGYVDGGFDGWGTNGGIYKNPRFYTFTLNEGAYNINTEVNNGGNANYMQASTWLDGNAVGQTFEVVDAEIPTYRFGNGSNWFGGTAKNAIWTLAADATNTEWLLISEDEYKTKLKELEYDGSTYFNASALIKGARSFRNFTNGIDKEGNWTISRSGGSQNLNGGSNQYRCAEFYNCTFDMYQVIEDVPNGKYVFSVQGLQRISDNSKPTVIYANEAESPMMLLSEGSATGVGSMAGAAEAFFNGDFDNNKVTVIVTDHTLKIGLKKETQVAGNDWVSFNNFSLYFYGLDLTELKAALQSRLDVANAISGQYEATLASTLATAISNATSALTSNDADIMASAQTALNAAIAAAEPSVAAYAKVIAAYDAADAIVAKYDDLGKAAYNAVVDDIKAAYTAGTLATAECDEKVTSINNALVAAAKATVQPQDGADMTSLIVNPSFENDFSGWTNNQLAVQTNNSFGKTGNKYVEFWQPNGTKGIKQALANLPQGYYGITVDAKARGLESAFVFANEDKTNMTIADEVNPYTVNTIVVTGVDLTFGVEATGTGASTSWIALDNFRLTYNRQLTEEEIAANRLANEEEIAAYNAAVEGIEGNLGFEAGEYAPYNNVDALAALTAAKVENPAKTKAVSVVAATTTITGLSFTANAEEVNAIYDGTFTLSTAKEGDYNVPTGWTNLGYNTRIYNAANSWGGNTVNDVEGILFAKYNTTYGEKAGYTMPLKKGVYSLDFLYGGWNQSGANRDIYLSCGDTKVTPLEVSHVTATSAHCEKGESFDTYNGKFVIPSDGDYVLTFEGPSGQNQFLIADIKIFTVPETAATMAISDAKYATFIAPFAVTIPEGVTASKVTGVDENGNTLTMEEIETTIPANTPVVVYSESTVNETFNGQSIAINNEYTAGLLTGVYTITPAPAGSYVLQKQSGKVAFYQVGSEEGDAQPNVPANRAYLTVPASSGVKAFFFGEDSADAIQSVFDGLQSGDIYDLAGRKVSRIQKGGVYIVNGKKVAVK